MIKSMTGYGRAEVIVGGRTITVEIRSVNHRYSEITTKLHGRCSFSEDAIKRLVKSRIGRGKVDVAVYFYSVDEKDTIVTLNTALAKQYFSGLRELQKSFDTTGEISLEFLASLPEVLKQDRHQAEEDSILDQILLTAETALDSFDEMRIQEGKELGLDLEKRLDVIGLIVEEISKRAPEVRDIYAARLKERIASFTDKNIDEALIEQRLAMEIAIFADKSSIDEELVRLLSHIDQFKKAIQNDKDSEPVGKKLDFIIQEMNRETNTIGSKANDLHITELMIELKNGIENIREQVQNII